MVLVVLAVLVLVAAPLAHVSGGRLASTRDTCPEGIDNCSPESNWCTGCHWTCEYCQRLGDDLEEGPCGASDCMTCLPGLHLVVLWEDGTGECRSADKLYQPTCPKSHPNCLTGNRCEQCHESCELCQGDDTECGPKDCMTCSEGYVHWKIFNDNTGECLPRGVTLERHELTCPHTMAGCSEDNRCLTCHPSCDLCQNLHPGTSGACGPADCVSCKPNHELVLGANGATGECLFGGTIDKVPAAPHAMPHLRRQWQQQQQPPPQGGEQAHQSRDGAGGGADSGSDFWTYCLSGVIVFAFLYSLRKMRWRR